jgi:hypothetical protein
LEEIVQKARLAAQRNPRSPVRFQTPIIQLSNLASHEPLPEIVELAQNLIRIPSVTACPNERLSEVLQASLLVNDYLQQSGLDVRYYDSEKYPAVLASFPGKAQSRVMLVGHFDVVEPDPDETQFIPRIEGDYIWGRGSADMKTVVATYLVWMKERMGLGSPYPSINLLLVGNEENGEVEPSGTPHILRHLQNEEGYIPEILIAGGTHRGKRSRNLDRNLYTESRRCPFRCCRPRTERAFGCFDGRHGSVRKDCQSKNRDFTPVPPSS